MYEDLSPLAEQLGRHMAERCADGLIGYFGDDVLSSFPEASLADIRKALSELEAEGLIATTMLINRQLPRIRTTLALFVACDAGITGQNPIDDSIILARMLLADRDLGGNARNLEAATGWERRRFNPAFALVVPCIGKGRIRDADQSDYPVLGVLVGDDDVVTLQRYIREHMR